MSANYAAMILAQAPYEMNRPHYLPPSVPSLPFTEDPLFCQLGMGDLAPTGAPMYQSSSSAARTPQQAHATMLGLPYISPQYPSSASPQLDLPSDFMPVFDTVGDSYGSYGYDGVFACDYDHFGRTEDVIATKADKRD